MDGTVAIANYRTKIEAEAAAGVLEAAGIPCIIQSTEGMLHGPINPGASILVSRAVEAEARAVLGEPPAGEPPEDVA